MADSFDKDEIEKKIDAKTHLTDTEKAAAKAKIFELISVVTKASIGSEDRKEFEYKGWHLCCTSSISQNNISNAIDVYAKLDDDGTRLRDIINDAYKQFIFLTPIDYMLNFIKALPTTHLKVSGVYALLAAVRLRYPEGNVKMFRIQEFIEEDIVPKLSETEMRHNNLYEKLPGKVLKMSQQTVKFCIGKIFEEKYGEIMFYGRECPENFMKHLPDIVNEGYTKENYQKVVDFVLALPIDSQKIVALKELLNQIRKQKGPHDLSSLEERIKTLANPTFDSVLKEIQILSSTEITKL